MAEGGIGVAITNSLALRGLTIAPPLALAPMVGLSHSALRTLVVEEGGAGLLFTEMLAARKLPQESDQTSPYLIRGKEERPLFYQLFLTEKEDIAPAVDRLHQLHAQGIDLNLGCPAPQLRRHGAGVFLTGDPQRVRILIQTLRAATNLPVSAKIRLGECLDEGRLLAFCRMLEGEGVDLLTVHGRLDKEKFCRRPRWDWIGMVKGAVTIPVLANGGIFSVEDARQCLQVSGADGLMLGRGAACRPWLCAEIARRVYGQQIAPTGRTAQEVFNRFATLLEERFPLERRLGRLKQFSHYFAQNFQFGHILATSVQNSLTMDEAKRQAEEFFLHSTV
ncbi:nifR3 family TIM-barrel protein [Desulfoprunum benzoelyticum]|uniref:tRNA-dihydrouridine synthase n=1 Tax=Desulfoprunum benzoelyticum TaxID=1506996 RepID=A0A840UPA8_9BACT|nr:tRNA-dihydrouridine synthase family protein [Desulfoprunum benzoelyticum]MBB5346393.1 nifR3 family TIM-barrel protein [Desulfoprunum benzoelyticum]